MGNPLWSVTPNRILNGLIASLSNILTDSSEINFIVISIITSFLRKNEDDTHCSVSSIVLNLAYKVCRMQLTTYGLAFVYLFSECRKVSFSSMCPQMNWFWRLSSDLVILWWNRPYIGDAHRSCKKIVRTSITVRTQLFIK